MGVKKKNNLNEKEILEELRQAPNKSNFEKLLLQISDEFDQGDFSSLDPEFPSQDFIDAMKRDEQRLKEWDAKKKQEKAKKSSSQKRRSEKAALSK